jgi:hypothetical protein
VAFDRELRQSEVAGVLSVRVLQDGRAFNSPIRLQREIRAGRRPRAAGQIG